MQMYHANTQDKKNALRSKEKRQVNYAILRIIWKKYSPKNSKINQFYREFLAPENTDDSAKNYCNRIIAGTLSEVRQSRLDHYESLTGVPQGYFSGEKVFSLDSITYNDATVHFDDSFWIHYAELLKNPDDNASEIKIENAKIATWLKNIEEKKSHELYKIYFYFKYQKKYTGNFNDEILISLKKLNSIPQQCINSMSDNDLNTALEQLALITKRLEAVRTLKNWNQL